MNILNGIKQTFFGASLDTLIYESGFKDDFKYKLLILKKNSELLGDLSKASVVLAVSCIALLIFKGFLVSLLVAPILAVSVCSFAAVSWNSRQLSLRCIEAAMSLYKQGGEKALDSAENELTELGFSKKEFEPFFFGLRKGLKDGSIEKTLAFESVKKFHF